MKKKKRGDTAPISDNIGFTIIAENSRIIGDIVTKDNLRISGQVEGNCTTSGKLIISEKADILGNLRGQTIDIYGKVNGDVIADNRIYLSSVSSLSGNCLCQTIKIDEGAFLIGNINKKQKGESRKNRDHIKDDDDHFPKKVDQSGSFTEENSTEDSNRLW